MFRCKAVAVALCAAFAAGPSGALAQTYPNRPIHLVAGNPPGGATDMIARIIGTPLGERLGHNIVIEHKPGAHGNIPAEVTAAAKRDGYTLLYAIHSTGVVHPRIYTN